MVGVPVGDMEGWCEMEGAGVKVGVLVFFLCLEFASSEVEDDDDERGHEGGLTFKGCVVRASQGVSGSIQSARTADKEARRTNKAAA